MRIHTVALFLALAGMIGCQEPPSRTEQTASDDDRLISSYASLADTVAILLWDPAECFVCRPTLQDWLRWGTSGPGRATRLILTREPTPAERNVLITARLTYGEWLVKSPGRRSPPKVYLYVTGQLVDSATGHNEASATLFRW